MRTTTGWAGWTRTTKAFEPGTKAEWEELAVAAAQTRPFLVPAKTWTERVAQLDFALELHLGQVAA